MNLNNFYRNKEKYKFSNLSVFTIFFPWLILRHVIITLHPFFASNLVVANPIPAFPPVIIASLPSSLCLQLHWPPYNFQCKKSKDFNTSCLSFYFIYTCIEYNLYLPVRISWMICIRILLTLEALVILGTLVNKLLPR